MLRPDYYLPIMPYLVVSSSEEFIRFIKATFNAKEELIVPREDGSIMHAEFSLNNGSIMFTQATEEYPVFPCSMFLLVEDIDDAYSRGLAAGAISLQSIEDREYGRSAGLKDSCGNVWWLTNK